MSWVYIDAGLTEDMPGTCTCMHLHAPPMHEGEKGVSPTPPSSKRHLSNGQPKPKTYTYKTLRLRDLPTDRQWWADRATEHPGVDLLAELEKAADWHGIEKIKNAKIFFRNWLAKTKPAEADPEDLARRFPNGYIG